MVYTYKNYFCYRGKGFEVFAFSLAELITQMKTIYKIDITNYLN